MRKEDKGMMNKGKKKESKKEEFKWKGKVSSLMSTLGIQSTFLSFLEIIIGGKNYCFYATDEKLRLKRLNILFPS